MTEKLGNVLFLCTGNSARSILAEVLLTHWAKGAFTGYSAGSHPKGEVHPLTIETLERVGLPTNNLRSKSWDEFAQPGAPEMNYVLTVCDQAKGELCPIWPGHPIEAHWGVADPAAAEGSLEQRRAAFKAALMVLQTRIQYFLTFRFRELKRAEIEQKVRDVGTMT